MLSIYSARKYVLYDSIVSFMTLVDLLPKEERQELVESLRVCFCRTEEPEEERFISAVEKFVLSSDE